MSDKCLLDTRKKFDQMSEDNIRELEAKIAEIETAHKGDTKAMNKEMKEVLTNMVRDEKYNSVRVIQDKLKTDAAKKRIIVKNDWKQSAKNFLDFFERKSGIESTYRGYHTKYTSMYKSALAAADGDLERKFYSGEYDELIHRQNYNKAHKLPDVDNKDAVKMFNIIQEVNDVIYRDYEAAGLNMGYRRDFLVSRNYSADKMLAVGKEAWIKDMKDNYLNLEETFSASALKKEGRVDEILGEVFDDIIDAQKSWQPRDMIGGKSALNKLKGRKFEFKDGKAEWDFSQSYGNGKKLAETLEYQTDRNAKTVANVELMGTNAKKTFEVLTDAFEKEFRETVPPNELKALLNKVNIAYNETVAPPHSPSTAFQKSVNLMRGLQAFTKLGSSIFAAAWDLNSSALQYSIKSGESQFMGYAKSFKEFIKVAGLSRAERKELGRLLNVNTWFNDAAVVLGGHKGDYDTGFDKINRFFTGAQKFTGVPFQTELSRITNAINQAHAFNKIIDNLDNLNSFQKLQVEDFGLSMDQLKMIKQHAKKDPKLGLITPDAILKMDNDLFSPNALQATRMKNELFRKYSSFIDDSVQFGTPTPTARAKRHLLKDRTRDETTRAVANLVVQFKETAWQIALANKDAYDTYVRAGGHKAAGMGMLEYMTLGLVSYMGFETMKAVIFDQETPFEKLQKGDSETLRKLFFDYANKSSIAPLLSDALDQGTSPYFGSNVQNFLLGPTLGGTVPDAFNVVKSNNKGKAARRFVKRNFTPSNWVPYKAANRHLFQYDLLTGDRIRK